MEPILRSPTHSLFEPPQINVNIAVAPFEFQDRITDELSWPVIRDLAAARDAKHRDSGPRLEQVASVGAAAQGEDVRMLEHQQRIADQILAARR